MNEIQTDQVKSSIISIRSEINKNHPKEFLIGIPGQLNQSGIQPSDGSYFILDYESYNPNTPFIFPSGKNFTNLGYKYTIFNISGNTIQINRASDFSYDTIIYNLISYYDNSKFILENRGFITLMFYGQGFLVTESCGLSIQAPLS